MTLIERESAREIRTGRKDTEDWIVECGGFTTEQQVNEECNGFSQVGALRLFMIISMYYKVTSLAMFTAGVVFLVDACLKDKGLVLYLPTYLLKWYTKHLTETVP